jgi:hypothetical protein
MTAWSPLYGWPATLVLRHVNVGDVQVEFAASSTKDARLRRTDRFVVPEDDGWGPLSALKPPGLLVGD